MNAYTESTNDWLLSNKPKNFLLYIETWYKIYINSG